MSSEIVIKSPGIDGLHIGDGDRTLEGTTVLRLEIPDDPLELLGIQTLTVLDEDPLMEVVQPVDGDGDPVTFVRRCHGDIIPLVLHRLASNDHSFIVGNSPIISTPNNFPITWTIESMISDSMRCSRRQASIPM